jgi:hypothetical protein
VDRAHPDRRGPGHGALAPPAGDVRRAGLHLRPARPGAAGAGRAGAAVPARRRGRQPAGRTGVVRPWGS